MNTWILQFSLSHELWHEILLFEFSYIWINDYFNLAVWCNFLFSSYTLFPLLLLLDAAIQCRSTQKVDSQENYNMPGVLKTPVNVSDGVAEGVVNCLEELLRKCRLNSVDQVGWLEGKKKKKLAGLLEEGL